MGRHVYPRLVRTELPIDGEFRFKARARREGIGMRITIPAPVARGLQAIGAGSAVRVQIEGVSFVAYLRTANSKQWVIGLPQSVSVKDGDALDLVLTALDRRSGTPPPG